MAEALESEPLAAANAVTAAGAEAVEAEPNPARKRAAASRAIKKEAETRNLQLSDEDIDRIAERLVHRQIEELEARGAFDGQPEPVAAPASVPDEHATPAAAQPQPEAPRKKSWAEKFRSA